jgi:uracil-DNA glycosylase
MDKEYQEFILEYGGFFPSCDKIFSAFCMPRSECKYILFGQDPYPRVQSANGFAFIDADVGTLWSDKGLSKKVNRATSLRNMMKMFLLSEGLIDKESITPDAISKVDKSSLIDNINELKDNFVKNGFLLLNSALIFEDKKKSTYHSKQWQPFIRKLLSSLEDDDITLLLWGNLAKQIDKLNHNLKRIYSEHPYNISFITNEKNVEFFKDFHLLNK